MNVCRVPPTEVIGTFNEQVCPHKDDTIILELSFDKSGVLNQINKSTSIYFVGLV